MKIDIVYTWVDGSDPIWKQKKIKRAEQIGKILPEANSTARFADNDELRYSLRSIDKFAPWINNIFIVTDNQIPKWLNISHPKINIVDHSDIFSDKTILPTFSSQVIESQLHHIKNLSEHFIYFNDDMFLGNYCTPNFFFSKKEAPFVFVSEIVPIPQKKIYDIEKRHVSKRNTYQYTLANTRNLLKSKLNKSVYFNIRHGIKPVLKSVLYEIENIFEKEIRKSNENFFRTKEDILMIYLFEFYAISYNLGKAKYAKTVDTKTKLIDKFSSFYNKFTFGYINLHEDDIKEHLIRLKNSKPFTYCLNQTPETPSENIILIERFLQDYFPIKSSFEN